jgi:integrase
MASIHRRPNSKFWHASWYDANGRQILRSTKQTDRKLALAMAVEFERAERLAKETKAKETQYRKVLNDIMVRSGSMEQIRTTSVRDWFGEWLRRKEVKRSGETADRYRGVINTFLSELGARAEAPLGDLRASDIDNYITGRLRSSSSKTTKLHLEVIRSALELARRQGLLESNPAEAVETPEGGGETHEPFTNAEVVMLLRAASAEWKTLILLGARTGARLVTLASLLWDQVDLAKGVLTIAKPGKRGNAVAIPLHPDLLTHLEGRAGSDTPDEHVMPTLAGLESGGKRGLSRQFHQLMNEAGVDRREVTNSAGRSFAKRSFHSLRHTFVSDLANSGSNPEIRRKLTGHKTASVHDLYTHFERETLRAAVHAIPTLPEL